MRTLAVAVWLFAVSIASAQAPALIADGKRMPATLVGIDAELKVALRGSETTTEVPAADLVLWGTYRDVERGPQIVMNDGSVVVGDVLDIGAKEITVGDATGLGRVLWSPSSLPRRAVRGIVYQPPADAPLRDKLLDEVLQSETREDELRLVGGEVIRGTLLSGDAQRLGPQPPGTPADDFRMAVRGRGEPLVVSAAKVETVILAAGGRTAAASGEGTTLVTLGLQDGSLLTCRAIRPGKSSVELELAAGGVLKAVHEPLGGELRGFWDEVTLVQPRSERVKYLSDLETIGYKHIPFTAVEWPYGRDHSVLATRLRSGGTIQLKGLGMHSASRLAYDLDGGWKRLEAEIALDDAAGLAGSVVFKVVLEEGGQWQTAYESPVVRGGGDALPVSVDLKGASRVALLVEYADHGDVLDHANWLNARLVK